MSKLTRESGYYVYIIYCKDGSYYTGHAKDVEKRFDMHKNGRGARYTRMHEPEKLVYVEPFESRSEAMRLIRQGAVSIDGKKISNNLATLKSGSIIKVGKRRFAKVINTDKLTG